MSSKLKWIAWHDDPSQRTRYCMWRWSLVSRGASHERRAERRDVHAPQTQATSGAMPSERQQMLGAALHGAQQIERRDTAPRPLGFVVALAEQDSRAIEALHDARRDDADDAFCLLYTSPSPRDS